ncbi:MAG: phosphoribulokinase [Proteobacteria bacterium]|nr:phosphoribulokinase [Pseudomonadota bacterium]MDA1331509.1 phosphoribulokinase [Pseudomonadota bacterium]
MSRAHPIIAVTGASGAGTTSVQHTFKSICAQAKFRAVFVEGDSFHRYAREEMRKLIDAWERTAGRTISHFGPEANLLEKLEALFSDYGRVGLGRARIYLHDENTARAYGRKAGAFTEWSDIEAGSDLLIYEGLHGGAITDVVNIAQHVDLLIGVTPTINLEWIQKLHRDQKDRGHSVEDVTQTILRRMPDYIEHIVPQYSRTHINFQRVPTVDTSNPFANTGIPSPNESLIVIRFTSPSQQEIDDIINSVHGSFQSKEDSVVVPGQAFEQTLELVLKPRVTKLVANSRQERAKK